MDAILSFLMKVNDIVWSKPLVYLCLAAGVYFTIRFKGCQFRLFGDMIKLIRSKSSTDEGISAFQSFATTVGSRVGMGNIAGVATAIWFGGPGAVFWMWLIAILGTASSFAECTLAQAYKESNNGEYVGGPQVFITKGLKMKPLAIAFAVSAVLGPGTLMPPIQVRSIASTFQSAFGTPMIVTGIITTALIAFVVCGGIKRIGQVAELLAPVMCVVYCLMAIIIFGANISKVPAVFALIFKSAFGMEQAFAGIMGSCISWGVKRGVYSNEAGQGSGAIVSAAANCNHPAEQGLVQALSVYIDTIVICSASAMIIMLTDNWSVIDGSGNLIVSNTASEYGILWAQDAVNGFFGGFGGKLLAIMVLLFVFTSFMGYYYQAEANMMYLCKGKKIGQYAMRVIFLVMVFLGVILEGDAIWSLADLGVGFMAWFNIIAILLLSNKAVAILKDYEEQKKAGKTPYFNPAKFGIEDETGAWNFAVEELKKRGEA